MENTLIKKLAPLALVFPIGMAAFMFFNSNDCQSFYETKLKPKSFRGHILKKYKDKNHAYPRVYVKTSEETFLLPLNHADESGFFESGGVGDSIGKKANSLDVHIWSISYDFGEKKKYIDHNIYRVGCNK